MTIIGPRAVNPLKAAWDVEVALRHLLAPERADLMSPVRAVSDCLRRPARPRPRPCRRHPGGPCQPPRALQPVRVRRAPAGRGARQVPPGNRKARQWELLLDIYEDLARDAKEDFWSMFEREFRRAYSTASTTDKTQLA
jgi:FHA domain-containing protein